MITHVKMATTHASMVSTAYTVKLMETAASFTRAGNPETLAILIQIGSACCVSGDVLNFIMMMMICAGLLYIAVIPCHVFYGDSFSTFDNVVEV